MNLLRFLLRSSRAMVLLATFASVVSGACNSALIVLISMALSAHGTPTTTWVWKLVTLVVIKLLSNATAGVVLTRFLQRSIADLRTDLSRRILDAPLRRLEETGIPRLLTTLTDDIQSISAALRNIPNLIVNAAVLMGCSIYLAWLSPPVFLVFLALTSIGVVGYRSLVARGLRSLGLAREQQEILMSHFKALTEGIKELKLHRDRREAFVGDKIQSTSEAYQRSNVRAATRFIIAFSWSHLLLFALIGLTFFALPRFGGVTNQTLSGYALTTVYLMGPLGAVLNVLPDLGRAIVALQKIDELGLLLRAGSGVQVAVTSCAHEAQWEYLEERLELVGVTYTYRSQDDSSFTVGPINLTFIPGEIIFLIGPNGSGKSTFAKILTGLYTPEQGDIRLDGRLVTDKSRDEYRQLFSAVFSDSYVFESLLGFDSPRRDIQAEIYLSALRLDHKVTVKNGIFSTTALSQGQRKRLALLTAYLEDRPFYVFDEWAADQDLQLREIFYGRILQDLKTRGKAVLVISHDDRYYHLADRIVRLESGKIDSDYDKLKCIQTCPTTGI